MKLLIFVLIVVFSCVNTIISTPKANNQKLIERSNNSIITCPKCNKTYDLKYFKPHMEKHYPSRSSSKDIFEEYYVLLYKKKKQKKPFSASNLYIDAKKLSVYTNELKKLGIVFNENKVKKIAHDNNKLVENNNFSVDSDLDYDNLLTKDLEKTLDFWSPSH